jgi:hypothetical protein
MGEEPITVTEASVRWGLPETSARVLAQSLCCMRILVHKNGLLTKSELAQNLAAGGFLLDECRKPLESIDVLKGELQSPKPQAWYQIRDDGQAPDDSTLNPGFYRKLHPIRLTWGEQLAGRYDFSGHRELIDIGGASGGWLMGIRTKAPHLRCVIYDIAAACAVADELIAEAGQQEHIRTVTGNFFDEQIPSGADVALLANVLHDWTIDDCRRILANVHHALPVGGVLLVNEAYFEDDWSAGSMFPLHQAFVVNGEQDKCGWQPSFGEMESLLAEEGFTPAGRAHNLVISHRA